MRIITVPDYAAMSRVAADLVSSEVAHAPRSVLGLATGSTPEGLYAELVTRVRMGALNLNFVTTFNLDEYIGLPTDHETSYHSFMRRHLLGHVKVRESYIPNGNASDLAAECRRYDNLIAEIGGIDLQILGIGRNGHIGFNEPGSPFGDGTRIVDLTADTIEANARFFTSIDEVPRQALSMGIKTIMRARSIVLLASGASKAQAVAGMIKGPVTEALPASVLRLHPDATLIVDEAAASLLSKDELTSA